PHSSRYQHRVISRRGGGPVRRPADQRPRVRARPRTSSGVSQGPGRSHDRSHRTGRGAISAAVTAVSVIVISGLAAFWAWYRDTERLRIYRLWNDSRGTW